jgi:hypothetical protein
MTEDIYKALGSGIQDPTQISFFGVCVESCPEQNDFICDYVGLKTLSQIFPAQASALKSSGNVIRAKTSSSRRLNVGTQSPEYLKLESCQAQVDALPSSAGAMIGLAPWTLLPGAGDCGTLLQHCWPNPQPSKSCESCVLYLCYACVFFVVVPCVILARYT